MPNDIACFQHDVLHQPIVMLRLRLPFLVLQGLDATHPPAVGQTDAISPMLAAMTKLQSTQKIKPYTNATGPPDGSTMASVLASAIQVLWSCEQIVLCVKASQWFPVLQYSKCHASHRQL